MEKSVEKHKVVYYGGKWMAFVPIVLALIGLVYISVQKANIPEYWVVFLLPLILCSVIAKDKQKYANAIIQGLSEELSAILVMAIILAGINGAIIGKSGVILTLTNYMVKANFIGSKYIVAAFILTCIIAFSTGTSVGTMFVVGPVLYPVGYLVGAAPPMLIGAIVSGAAFGDNLSPVSDTTIASATTQGMDLGGVVRSRLKYSIPAAVITLILYYLFSGTGEVLGGVEKYITSTDPKTLLFLLVPAVIIFLCLTKQHLIIAIGSGIIVGLIIGLATGVLSPSDIISVPGPFEAGGIILEGINNGIPIAIVVLFLFAHLNLLKAGGGIDLIMNSMDRFVTGVRSAEATIVSILLLLNCATGLNSAAILGTGEIANRLGKEYNIHGYRRANLMDCAGTTLCYLLPYMVPVVVGSMISTMFAPFEGAVVVSPLQLMKYQYYPWVMLFILIFSIITGYGRSSIVDSPQVKQYQ